jgi:hypothetical protein
MGSVTYFGQVPAGGDTDAAPLGEAHDPLISYVLKGLHNCWMPQYQRWSHIYHLDGRATPNQSVPESDVFYSLNASAGFSATTSLAKTCCGRNSA